MKWPTIPIADVTTGADTWNPTAAPSNDPFDYIDISAIDRGTKTITSATRLSNHNAPSRARQLVIAGDVLVSTVRPNLNAVAQVPPELDGATASTGFTVLRPAKSRLDSRYLLHWVRTPAFVNEMTRRSTGANYPAVTDEAVRTSRIPLPPIPEQQLTATILDKADAIRRKRQASIRLADDFLRSVFLDMFGDPVTNPKGWRTCVLSDIAEIASGVTKGRKLNDSPTVSVPYMRVTNVQDGEIRLDDVASITVLPEDVKRYALQAGDILLTEGGDPDKLGRGAVWRGQITPCIHQNHIFRVRVSGSAGTPEFVSAMLGSALGKRYFFRCAKQTTGIASINMTQLRQCPVLLPPLPHQQAYATLLQRLRESVSRSQAAGRDADMLFQSLSHRAFAGEL
jgi:type I restriction enzyme S subunit